jgi:hypothetical protein
LQRQQTIKANEFIIVGAVYRWSLVNTRSHDKQQLVTWFAHARSYAAQWQEK